MAATIEPVPLTQSDFDLLKNIEPRKSVLNFSSEELSATSSWSSRFGVELEKKSPFFRAVNGEWRDKERSYVPIIKVECKNSTYASVKSDIRENVIYRSTLNDTPINIDTGWKIQTSRKGIEDMIKYAFKHKDSVSLDMLYSLKELVENGVLLDSVTSERNKANKAYNTAFMHRLYCICEVGGEHYLTNMAIEEFADAKGGTLKRLYNLQGIKTEPLRLIGLAENQLHPAVLNGSRISIADLFQFVKTFDKNFYVNVRNEVENIPPPRDGSHITTNAAPTAIRAESRGNIMDNKVTIFEMSKLDFDGVERGHAYIGDFSINELLKAANSEHPFDELMKLGKTGREFWDDYEYVSFEQSNRFTASLKLDLYRSEGRYYEVNDGKGGIDEEHREGKCRFVRGKISELGEKIAEAIEMRGKAPGKANLTRTIENVKQAEPVPQPRDVSHITTNAALSATRAESRGKIMEQKTELMAIRDVTPEFLADFAQKTNSFYQSDADVPECRINYVVNDDDNTIMFSTLNEEIDFKTASLIPGELRVTLGGDLGTALYENLDEHWEREFHVNLKAMFEAERKEKQAEPVPQPRDGSHITTNADLSAKRGESRGKIMEQNTTKFEMSTMSKLEGDGPAKAIGTLVVNGEFAVHGVKVMEGKNGLYVSLPSEKRGGVWEETVFPVTKEARASLNSAVLDAYDKLAASPDKTLKNEIAAPEKPVSKVYAEMHKVESETSQTKAAGQITIDKCFVVTGVKLNEGTNTQGQTKTFVAMPAKPNEKGGYDDVAHPITADFHNKVDKAVIASANNIGRYEYKGVKYAELGENPAQSKPLHPKFADKLMAQLDKAGITYQAKCAETVVISVKAADKQAFDAAQKDLSTKLNGKDKPQQKQTTGTQTQKR